MYREILVPTDGSDAADSAVQQGLELAERFDARVHLLYVVDLSANYPPTIATEPIGDSLAQRGRELLEDIADRAPAGIAVETAVLKGSAHEEILAYADEVDIDVIVMGTHGRRGLDRFLLGSVTERVLRSAECSVLVTREGETGRRVDSPATAIERAQAVLTEEGADAVEILEEPYQQRGTWLVRAAADGQPVNVHIERSSGHTRIAEIESRG